VFFTYADEIIYFTFNTNHFIMAKSSKTPPKPTPKPPPKYRDSESGQYTTEEYAKKNPKTTEKESGPHKKK